MKRLVVLGFMAFLVVLFFSGCRSLGGGTKPVNIKMKKAAGKMPELQLGIVSFDSDKMYAQNTTPFKCAEAPFSADDLSNFKISLERGVRQITGESKPTVNINVVVRANMIAYSNGEVAILSAVDWCLSSERQVLFEESFFAAKHYGALAGKTLGGAKEDIMKRMVLRILKTSKSLSGGNKDVKPVQVDDIYDSFAFAVSKLPPNITFYIPGSTSATRYQTDWTILETMEEISWDELIGG
ncbi:MAG: hypothetical protein ACIAQZ_07495 [Sedimentisphaeraceae bacterium JB056]